MQCVVTLTELQQEKSILTNKRRHHADHDDQSASPIHSFHFIGVRIKWRNRGSLVAEDYLNHEVVNALILFPRLLYFFWQLMHAPSKSCWCTSVCGLWITYYTPCFSNRISLKYRAKPTKMMCSCSYCSEVWVWITT